MHALPSRTGALARVVPRTAGNGLLRSAGHNWRELLAILKQHLRSRAQPRTGLYLPLVRVDRDE